MHLSIPPGLQLSEAFAFFLPEMGPRGAVLRVLPEEHPSPLWRAAVRQHFFPRYAVESPARAPSFVSQSILLRVLLGREASPLPPLKSRGYDLPIDYQSLDDNAGPRQSSILEGQLQTRVDFEGTCRRHLSQQLVDLLLDAAHHVADQTLVGDRLSRVPVQSLAVNGKPQVPHTPDPEQFIQGSPATDCLREISPKIESLR